MVRFKAAVPGKKTICLNSFTVLSSFTKRYEGNFHKNRLRHIPFSVIKSASKPVILIIVGLSGKQCGIPGGNHFADTYPWDFG